MAFYSHKIARITRYIFLAWMPSMLQTWTFCSDKSYDSLLFVLWYVAWTIMVIILSLNTDSSEKEEKYSCRKDRFYKFISLVLVLIILITTVKWSNMIYEKAENNSNLANIRVTLPLDYCK